MNKTSLISYPEYRIGQTVFFETEEGETEEVEIVGVQHVGRKWVYRILPGPAKGIPESELRKVE